MATLVQLIGSFASYDRIMAIPPASPIRSCCRSPSTSSGRRRQVVGGYLRMLQRDTAMPLSERQRKMIDEAEKSCARLVALIAELSEISASSTPG